MTSVNEEKKIFLPIQGLRAIAILAILFYHCGNVELYQLATWAVSVFIILSGFLTGLKIKRNATIEKECSIKICWKYAWSHVKKLYPLHLIMLILSIPVSGMIEDISNYGAAKLPFWLVVFVMNVTLTKSWYPEYYFGFNGVAWFLSTYMVLCFVTPFLIKAIRKFRKKNKERYAFAVVILLFIAGFLYSWLIGKTTLNVEYWTYIFPFARLFEYLIGMLAGTLEGGFKKETLGIMQTLSVMSIVVLVFFVDMPQWLYRSVVWIVPNVLMILSIYWNENRCTKLLSLKPLVYIGGISGYIFLIHQVVYSYFTYYGLFVPTTMMSKIIISGIVLFISCIFTVGYQKLVKNK